MSYPTRTPETVLVGLGYVSNILLMVYPFLKIAVLQSPYLATDDKDQLIKAFQKTVSTIVDANKRSKGVMPPTNAQRSMRKVDQKIRDKRSKEAARLARNTFHG